MYLFNKITIEDRGIFIVWPQIDLVEKNHLLNHFVGY
jgi:hypothetical protein